jgi:hypothetical protein
MAGLSIIEMAFLRAFLVLHYVCWNGKILYRIEFYWIKCFVFIEFGSLSSVTARNTLVKNRGFNDTLWIHDSHSVIPESVFHKVSFGGVIKHPNRVR